jgi:hypothetical protein
MTSPVPSWFKGPKPPPDPRTAECPKCGAPVNEYCRYMGKAGGVHKGKDGSMTVNVPGQPMLRSHPARHAAARKAE